MNHPLVSVVIPTYRRPQLLERCLQALLAQNFPPDDYELIIVDDCPDDPATRMLVTAWSQRPGDHLAYFIPEPPAGIPVTAGSNGGTTASVTFPVQTREAQLPAIHYLATDGRHGPAAARNLGWRHAGGEIIAFTDDDCIPEPDWLAHGVAAFVGCITAVSGRVVVPIPANPHDNERNTTGLERSNFVTANCFYRKTALQAVGGFDERFATAWREDSDLYFSLLERGFPMAWARDAVVTHPVRPEPWGASLRQQKKSFYNALLYKKHPQLYWRFIQPSPPWLYYGILATALIALTGLFLRQMPLWAGGLGLWLVLWVLLIRLRLKGTSHAPAHVLEMAVTSLFIPFLSIFWRLRGSIHWRVLFL